MPTGTLPPNGASNAGGVGKNAILNEYLASVHTGLQCCKPYTSREVWKIKPRRTASSRALTAGLDVIRRRRRLTPPGHNPFGHNSVFCCRRTEPGGYFCWKLTLTRTPDLIRPMRRGPDPNRPTNSRKQGGYDLRVFARVVLVGHRRRQ